jgi:hypothetical protein
MFVGNCSVGVDRCAADSDVEQTWAGMIIFQTLFGTLSGTYCSVDGVLISGVLSHGQ